LNEDPPVGRETGAARVSDRDPTDREEHAPNSMNFNHKVVLPSIVRSDDRCARSRGARPACTELDQNASQNINIHRFFHQSRWA